MVVHQFERHIMITSHRTIIIISSIIIGIILVIITIIIFDQPLSMLIHINKPP